MTNEINTSGINETFEEYLEHHGIKGMHWGIRRTPEQLGHKVSKARERFEKYGARAQAAGEAGKTKEFNKYTKKAEKTYEKEVKLSKAMDKAIKKQVEADEKVINRGNVDDVLKIAHRLSDQQVNRAVTRLTNQKKIEGLKEDESRKLDRLAEGSRKIASVAGNIANIASSVRTFKQAAEGLKWDSVEAERKEVQYWEDERKKKRAKELDKIVRKANMNDVYKVRNELSVDQIEEVYKRIYLDPRNKIYVDRAAALNDAELTNTYAHLVGYSNAKKKK